MEERGMKFLVRDESTVAQWHCHDGNFKPFSLSLLVSYPVLSIVYFIMEKSQKYRCHCSFEKTQNFQKFKNLIFERFGEIGCFIFFKVFFNEFLKRKFWDFKWTETFKNEVLGPPQAEIFDFFEGVLSEKTHVPECNPTAAEWSFGPTCAPLTLSRLRRHVCAPLAAFGGVAPNAPLGRRLRRRFAPMLHWFFFSRLRRPF